MERQLIEQLFVRMSSIYGHLWSSRFASAAMLEAAKAEWASALYGLHVDAVTRAINACAKRHKMPPTLPEFLALCKPEAAPYHKPAPKLLEAPRNPEIARAALAECRRILGVPSCVPEGKA